MGKVIKGISTFNKTIRLPSKVFEICKERGIEQIEWEINGIFLIAYDPNNPPTNNGNVSLDNIIKILENMDNPLSGIAILNKEETEVHNKLKSIPKERRIELLKMLSGGILRG